MTLVKLKKKLKNLRAISKKKTDKYNQTRRAYNKAYKEYFEARDAVQSAQHLIQNVESYLKRTERLKTIKTVARDTRLPSRKVRDQVGGLIRFPRTYWRSGESYYSKYYAKHAKQTKRFDSEEDAAYFARTGRIKTPAIKNLKKTKAVLAECGYELRLIKKRK